MPSFASIASIALSLVAFSAPTFATANVESNLAARGMDAADSAFGAHLERRRPNHAEAYGYPFGGPKPTGTRKPMTPGGYVNSPQNQKKKSNQGAKCKKDSQCVSKVALSAATCDSGVCSFRCLGDTIKSNGACVGNFAEKQCTYDHNCKTSVRNAWPLCLDDKCTFECRDGFHAEGNACVKDAAKCNSKSCPKVWGGYSICSAGKCQAQCEAYLGYTLVRNKKTGEYRCINTQSDPENCGSVGNTCPPAYNGSGEPICVRGDCSLHCPQGTSVEYTPSHEPYCA